MDFELQPIKRDIHIDGFNSIYYFEFGKDFSHPPQRNDFWELMYVDSGEVNAITEGMGQTISQGQVIFNKPMELHAHISNKIVSNSMLVISFTSKSDAMDFFEKKVFTLDKTSKTLLSLFMNEATRALGEIPHEYANKNALNFENSPSDSCQLLECYLIELLLHLRRSGTDLANETNKSEAARELAQNSTVNLVIEYLKENLYSDVSLADICKTFYMGKSKLSKLFCEYAGCGPMEYYSDLKITEAKKLLREDVSVSTVSDMLSYSTIHSFSRAFKKKIGISPSEYKKKIKK
ncbi:MAG: helix-turn-helix domain-containing protein [Clostridia bacterium]|nr:helix-turn-helix domain-containing protein [Clostridia bacterium]